MMQPFNPRWIVSFSFLGNRLIQEDYTLLDKEKGIFIIADGFGGDEKSAQISCEAVRDFLFKKTGDSDATLSFGIKEYFSLSENILLNALIYANQKLFYFNQDKPINKRCGSSILASYLDGRWLIVASLGNCSAWLVRKNQDPVELVIPRSLARFRNLKNLEEEKLDIPLIALGILRDFHPEISAYMLQPSDCVILHTDGLSKRAQTQLFQLELNTLKTQEMGLIKEILKKEVFLDNASLSLLFF